MLFLITLFIQGQRTRSTLGDSLSANTSAVLSLNLLTYRSSRRILKILQITVTFIFKLSFQLHFFLIALKMNEFCWRTLTEYLHRSLVSSSALAAHLASRHPLWAEHQSVRGGWASRPSPGRGHRSLRPHRASPLGTPHWWHSNATPYRISERKTQRDKWSLD